MILDILLITMIVCYIVDISGIVTTIKQLIWKWLKPNITYQDYQLKPIDCVLCMSFWCGLLYIIFNGFSIYSLALVCLFSLLSEQINNLLRMIQYLFQRLIDIIITIIQ